MLDFKKFVTQPFDGLKLIAHCHEGEKQPLKTVYHSGQNALILIGPEGDFSLEEVNLAMKNGFVAVSLGEGFSGIFGDLGVDHIVEGGQTMNPSIEDILDAVEKVGAKNVFVLPNNSNVILAASQAAELSERNVIVLPTKNVAMGIGAVVAFNPEASVEENREAMTAAAEQVKTGQITFAVRDTVFEDKEIKEGDIIGIHNGRIEVVGQSIHDIALDLVKHVVEDGDSLITIYYGQDTKQEDADALGAEVAEMFSDLDVEVQYGGQPLYYYLISAE